MTTEQVHELHGVDLSWLHHSNRDFRNLPRTSSSPATTPTSTRTTSPAPLQTTAEDRIPTSNPVDIPRQNGASSNSGTLPLTTGRSPKRPGLLKRASSDKLGVSPEESKKKSTWMSSLKSKVSPASFQQQPQQSSTPPTPQTNWSYSKSPPVTSTPQQSKEATDLQDSTASGRSSSFSRALKRLSSNTATNSPSKPCGPGSTCPRRILNRDETRDRNPIKELDSSNLKRVAFSVDVEIAGHSRYTSDEPSADTEQKQKDKKLKEQGEAAALKHPEVAAEEKQKAESDNVPTPPQKLPEPEKLNHANRAPPPKKIDVSADWDDGADLDLMYSNPRSGSYDETTSRVQREVEEERKRAKERKKKENAISPPQLDPSKQNQPQVSPVPLTPSAKGDRPTTDPLRMYRRCCALREAPVLKRIKEQLERQVNANSGTSGIVTHLDLTGSRMQMPDIVCLSDWLAIVPVKQIILENSNLSDEAVRIILAGLAAAKPPENTKRKRGRSSPTRLKERDSFHTPGVVEKISFRNNPKITQKGWKYILLFITMCRSIRAMDLSQIPFAADDGSGTATDESEMAQLLYKCLSERLAGGRLEEMNLSECALTTPIIRKLTEAISVSGIRRLGLAGNGIDDEGLECVANYVRQGSCQGIDLSSNNFRGKLHILTEALHAENSIMLISLENCNLEGKDMLCLLPSLPKLQGFRGLDLSHNHELLAGTSPGLHILRKWLPQMPVLKRLHLQDVNMSPAEAIGLAEILPDVRNLCHINILNNPAIKALSSATTEEQSEEACAVFASLMAAVRVSKTLMAVDIEDPSPESSEIVKALAKQVTAYCIRNMDRFTASDAVDVLDSASIIPDQVEDITVPEILAHLIGYDEQGRPSSREIKPIMSETDESYIVGGTGVVKALQYCLGQKAAEVRRTSSALNSPIGTGSPSTRLSSDDASRAKAMSKALLQSARRIRENLEQKLAQETGSGDEMAYRRLQFFDSKISEMIARFEKEFPETRIETDTGSISQSITTAVQDEKPRSSAGIPIISQNQDHTITSSQQAEATSDTASTDRASDAGSDSDVDTQVHPQSRRPSSASTANQILAEEEGNMHRLGQRMKRNILRPVGTDDHLHRTSVSDAPEAPHLLALRQQLEQLNGAEIRDMMADLGLEKTYESFADTASMLQMLQRDKPEEFKGLKTAQVLASYNAGRISRKEAEREIGAQSFRDALNKPNGGGGSNESAIADD